LMEVRLTGGEPTSHPDFLAILHRFKERGVYVSVATNGVWDRRTRDALSEEDSLWVICSVDGSRETHNRYRPGTFDTIIGNLKQLKRRNPSTRIRLTTVLTQENKGQMFALAQVCASVEAESLTVIPLRPQVRCPEIRADLVAADEFKAVIEDLVRAKDRWGIPFTTTMETDYKDEIYRDPIVRKRSSCAAGREATNLDYDAAKREFIVYACSYSPASDLEAHPALRHPFLAGSFDAEHLDSFLRIWREEEVWRIYRDLSLRSRDCRGCAYLAEHRCTGSCPIQNIDYARIDVEGDVLGQLKDQITRTGEWYCYQRILGSITRHRPDLRQSPGRRGNGCGRL
jgi:MoaA/NifB/PqqE/SkfB family radical SAM enzyme